MLANLKRYLIKYKWRISVGAVTIYWTSDAFEIFSKQILK